MFESAIAQLQVRLEQSEINAVAWESEGNTDEANLSREHAESYRAAIERLKE